VGLGYHRAPMPDRPRYYLTTAIAYANSKPGVHTLYEVIGADVIARWHRMIGDDTRFLTGTDEHSINIAQAAVDEGRPAREFVDEKVELFKSAEDALGISPDRFIRTTDPDHVRAAQEMVRRAHSNGDIYLGTYEGWYCPNEGFRSASEVVETARGTICPNHPDVPLQWLTERNWFFRLSAYQERLERFFADHPDFVQPDFRRNEMLGFIRGGLEDFSISRERTPGGWGIPFPIAENGETAQREDGSWDPEAGVIYVWFDALINYITGAGFPHDPASFERWWPADLHVIGKDISRFHTIFWPAMLWSAGLEAPRRVWVHGFLYAAGGERMSKSRGNFMDPHDFVAAFGSDGARYVLLREVPFDRDAEVSWDSFVRRYNADLANDFGNLVNRTVSMTKRYLEGVRPAPRAEAASPLAEGWNDTIRLYAEALEGCRLHDALAELWEFVGGANRVVDAEKPWELAKAWKAGDEAAGDRLRGVLGDLVEACRLVGMAAAPFLPASAPRILAQLGYGYGFGPDGNGGSSLLGELEWGSRAGEAGRVAAPEPLFPRLESEVDASSEAAPEAEAPVSDS
jgi:methionyl-tRNA synthetase